MNGKPSARTNSTSRNRMPARNVGVRSWEVAFKCGSTLEPDWGPRHLQGACRSRASDSLRRCRNGQSAIMRPLRSVLHDHPMRLHILGICGTFMGGIAAIAKRAGHTVTGCDANPYPPMSTQLEALGIGLTEGFDAAQLDGVARGADAFVVGNVV